MLLRTIVLSSFVAITVGQDFLPVTKTSQAEPNVQLPSVTDDLLKEAREKASQDALDRRTLEDNLSPSSLLPATSHSAEARHQRFPAYSQITADLDFNATLFESGTKYLKEKLKLTNDQCLYGLKKFKFPNDSPWDETIRQCKAIFKPNHCDNNLKHRSVDGSCNNLKHPLWGRSHSCMCRLLPPVYNDGISEPRKSVKNTDLPKARKISLSVHEALDTPNASVTLMVMQFGQFVTHDITLGLMSRTMKNHDMMTCCPLGQNNHTECSMVIDIPSNKEDFYTQHGQTCMNFVRSATCNSHCGFGPREQSSQITPYLDLSNVYGSTNENLRDLRKYKDGLMISQKAEGGEFLPRFPDPKNDQCSLPDQNLYCFSAGDQRVNLQIGLASMHNIFLRHHNRLARTFKKQHPKLDDNQLFNLARRVGIAQYQNIIYKEYMPLLLGPTFSDYYSLNVGNTSTYDPENEVCLFNEFMTAAFRFGHVLIQNIFQKGPGTNTSLNLDEVYFSSYLLMKGEFDPLLKGLAHQPGKQFERHLVTAVTHTMYRQKEDLFGMDLASLNIQRGRDQGTAPYTKYIQHCFNITITKFEDLDSLSFMSTTNRENLQKVYDDVNDIDLFTGSVSETSLPGGVVGPTFGCIIGIQFFRLKFGDRFFFEHKDQVASFTDKQLNELRKTTFAHILCENTETIKDIAPNVFVIDNTTNKITSCKNIPKVDYSILSEC